MRKKRIDSGFTEVSHFSSEPWFSAWVYFDETREETTSRSIFPDATVIKNMTTDYTISNPTRVSEFAGEESIADLDEITVRLDGDEDGDFFLLDVYTELPVSVDLEGYLYEEEHDAVHDALLEEFEQFAPHNEPYRHNAV